MLNWHDSAGFSALDGAPSEPTMSGWSRISTSTGHEEFPRTDPAVICLVHDGGDRVLLARQPTWPARRFSILAGFVEAGESLETCVVREIKEEVGVDVRDVRYLGSQPWPFPRSVMIGFAAVGDPDAPADVRGRRDRRGPVVHSGRGAHGTRTRRLGVGHRRPPAAAPPRLDFHRSRDHRVLGGSSDGVLDAEEFLDLRQRRVGRGAAVGELDGGDDVVAAVDAADELRRCRIVLDVDLHVADAGFVQLRLQAPAVAAPGGGVDGQGGGCR